MSKQSGILSAIIPLKYQVGVSYARLALTNGLVMGSTDNDMLVSIHEWKKGRKFSGLIKNGVIKSSIENNFKLWLTLDPKQESIIYLNVLNSALIKDDKIVSNQIKGMDIWLLNLPHHRNIFHLKSTYRSNIMLSQRI